MGGGETKRRGPRGAAIGGPEGHNGQVRDAPRAFEPLSPAIFVAIDGAVAVLVAILVIPGLGRALRRSLPWLTPCVVRSLVALTVVAHGAETIAAARLARSRGLDWRPWALQTALVGFPSLLALRRLDGGLEG